MAAIETAETFATSAERLAELKSRSLCDALSAPKSLWTGLTTVRCHGNGGRRLRVRRVDEYGAGIRAARRSLLTNNWVYFAEHGGTVCNSYGYRAETECLVVVAHAGCALGIVARVPANKATLSGAAHSCIRDSGWLWDGRVTGGELAERAYKALQDRWHAEFKILDLMALVST